MTGYVSESELERLYAEASVFAFPSLGEGFGIPVLEAMANELPVVTSRGSALAEIAEGVGMLVNPESTEEIAQALNALIEDGELRSRLGILGRDLVRKYSWERAVRSTHEVYREALG